MPVSPSPRSLRCPPPTGRAGDERASTTGEGGQATPLLAAALVLAAVLALTLARHGGNVVDAATARTAADAAALAGAAEGRRAAEQLAGANGATLELFRSEGRDVVVTVRRGRVRVTARARRDGTWCGPARQAGAATSYTSPPCPSSPG